MEVEVEVGGGRWRWEVEVGGERCEAGGGRRRWRGSHLYLAQVEEAPKPKREPNQV